MLKLFIGAEILPFIETQTREIANDGLLYIADELPSIPDWQRPKRFNTTRHYLNPLANPDYDARENFVEMISLSFTRGDGTLTKDTGLEFIAERLEENPRSLRSLIPLPDKKSSPGHIWADGKMRSLLRSPVLNRVFDASKKQFPLDPKHVVLARINRAEIRDRDARMLAWSLINAWPGQVVLHEFEFYGRMFHMPLIRQKRLIAGIPSLDQLAPQLRSAVLLIKDKEPHGALYDDAELLARYAGHRPDPQREDNDFNKYVAKAM